MRLSDLNEAAAGAPRKGWHTSYVPIRRLTGRPLFFATDLSHAVDGWHKNSIHEKGEAYLYEANLRYIATMDQQRAAFGEELGDFHADMSSSPDEDDIKSHPLVKKLRSMGFAGFEMGDYDPRDFSQDLDSVCVFDPGRGVSGWKVVKLPKRKPTDKDLLRVLYWHGGLNDEDDDATVSRFRKNDPKAVKLFKDIKRSYDKQHSEKLDWDF